jgi:hypothetical protein
MKQMLFTGFVTAMLMAGPAMAMENETFFAMKHVAGDGQTRSGDVHQMAQLSDQELSTVEGGDICVVCANVAAAVNAAVLNITGGDFNQTAYTGPQSLQ